MILTTGKIKRHGDKVIYSKFVKGSNGNKIINKVVDGASINEALRKMRILEGRGLKW